MFTRRVLVGGMLSTLVFGSAAGFGQQKAATPPAPPALEFPVTMEQSVTAGKTPVGTKIKAKLTVATLVNGVVFPKDAVFSGEVTESVAKSAAEPSRLALRMDSVEWKKGSAPIKVYLTGWYYPAKMDAGQDLAYGPPNNSVTWKTATGNGTYPDSHSQASQPFPGHPADGSADAGPSGPVGVSDHRVMMKNVESARNSDGSVVITCKRSNIKLDKSTTYVLAAGELVPSK
ncbi:MAG: hypothetical protein LAO56_16435 [Acidobacteriia bacterium]|nr:hypothetical protein [Terriglobia bacterium]